ncbi:hypothetical protein BDZ89DRAFT_1068329 [Hymenopellis radicata]|nr:hypothetical protein BDZ89DRAFT_1068329 [Hymenopellis radicata]
MSTNIPHRKVYLPLETLDACSVCSKKGNLRLCSACGEVVYCSGECQKAGWDKGHKEVKQTASTSRPFYPILAILADVCHVHASKDMHPALLRQVIGLPAVFGFPDDTAAKVVSLGQEIPPPTNSKCPNWWPTAPGDTAQRKLFMRIVREGDVLPIAAAVCIALLRATKESQRRVRLQYKSSPISDFGIAKGAVDVQCQDQLAYFDGDQFWKGQDPNDHYWIYFRTVRGEDIILDPSLYTFDFCIMVPSSPYTTGLKPGILPDGGMSNVSPGFLFGREANKGTIGLHTERQRVSVLRNPALHHAIRRMNNVRSPFIDADVDAMWAFIDHFANANTPLPDVWNVITSFVLRTSWAIEDILKRRAWVNWPADALIGFDKDDNQKDEDYEDEKWFRTLKKWTKKYKAGEISREAYDKKIRKRMK